MHAAFNPPGISCLAEPGVERNVKIHTWKFQGHWNYEAKPRARAWSQVFNCPSLISLWMHSLQSHLKEIISHSKFITS